MINSCAFLFSLPGFPLSHFVSFISISPSYLVLLHLCLSVYLCLPVPTFLSLYLSISLSLPIHFFSFFLCLFQSIFHYLYLTQWDYFFLFFFFFWFVLLRSLLLSLFCVPLFHLLKYIFLMLIVSSKSVY